MSGYREMLRNLILGELLVERERQEKKFGVDQYLDISDSDCLAVLIEEVGEVARELNEILLGNSSTEAYHRRLRKELLQTAAVAVAWIEALDEGKGSKDS